MNKYDTNSIRYIAELKRDLSAGKLNQEEFNFLLGLILKKEVNNFVQSQIEEFSPEPERSVTFVSYTRNRRLNHA